MAAYDNAFYDFHSKGSLDSAREVVPLVLQLLHPASVVDVGCGVGTWLAVYLENGLNDITGIDGNYVDRSRLQIDPSYFQPRDLSKPFKLDRQFDLVQSLEVAEHIDEQHADVFLTNLTSLGDIILFSAAIPFQAGTHHVNERFIDYWIERFTKFGFTLVDCIRPAIWKNKRIEVWYRQNIVIFARPECINTNPHLAEHLQKTPSFPVNIVHPELYSTRISEMIQVLLQCAQQFRNDGRRDLALRLATIVLQFNTRSAPGWNLSGQLEVDRKNFSAALQHFKNAVALEPRSAPFTANLAMLLDAMGDMQGAHRFYQIALDLDPGMNELKERLDHLDSQ